MEWKRNLDDYDVDDSFVLRGAAPGQTSLFGRFQSFWVTPRKQFLAEIPAVSTIF